jgi:hypothetical protein
MTRYFLINLLLLLFTVFLSGCSTLPGVGRTGAAKPSTADADAVWKEGLRSDSLKNSYRVEIKTGKNTITGLCISKKAGETWRGTLINEFGAKAFDFTVDDKGCKLLNVISVIDKWYIRKTIEADLYFLFQVDNPKASFSKSADRFTQNNTLVVNFKKKQIVLEPDATVLLLNRKHKITYRLRKVYEPDLDKSIM